MVEDGGSAENAVEVLFVSMGAGDGYVDCVGGQAFVNTLVSAANAKNVAEEVYVSMGGFGVAVRSASKRATANTARKE